MKAIDSTINNNHFHDFDQAEFTKISQYLLHIN